MCTFCLIHGYVSALESRFFGIVIGLYSSGILIDYLCSPQRQSIVHILLFNTPRFLQQVSNYHIFFFAWERPCRLLSRSHVGLIVFRVFFILFSASTNVELTVQQNRQNYLPRSSSAGMTSPVSHARPLSHHHSSALRATDRITGPQPVDVSPMIE